MPCKEFRRPTSITCACGAKVPVGRLGRVPWRCRDCTREHKRLAKLGLPVPVRPSHLAEETDNPRELGPERPLAGLTQEELLQWRKERAVYLYRTETELRLCDLAERLGVSEEAVAAYLAEAGISTRADGRGGRSQLAPGPPVP